MASGQEAMIATVVLVTVSGSLPFFLYGAWVVLRVDVVTWDVLTTHLSFIGVGLVLTTVPAVAWMVPRLMDNLDGYTVLHAVVGLQAYALLVFALTGIVRIFRAKRAHDLYHRPEQDIDLDDIHEDMDSWRFRLRTGVFGFLLLWILTWVIGIIRYTIYYTTLL